MRQGQKRSSPNLMCTPATKFVLITSVLRTSLCGWKAFSRKVFSINLKVPGGFQYWTTLIANISLGPDPLCVRDSHVLLISKTGSAEYRQTSCWNQCEYSHAPRQSNSCPSCWTWIKECASIQTDLNLVCALNLHAQVGLNMIALNLSLKCRNVHHQITWKGLVYNKN